VRDPLDRRVRATKREAANTGHRPRGEDEGKMVHQRCPCGHASGASYGSTLAARFQRCDPGIGRLGIVKSERIDLAIRYPSRREIDRRGHAAGGTTAHVLSPPHGGKTDRPLKLGKAAHRKKPQPGTVRVSPDKLLHLSLERTSQRHVGQVSWLAALSYSTAPSQGRMPQWSLQISLRSQLQGSDGFPPSSLLTAFEL
jgi:hypothetical protein